MKGNSMSGDGQVSARIRKLKGEQARKQARLKALGTADFHRTERELIERRLRQIAREILRIDQSAL